VSNRTEVTCGGGELSNAKSGRVEFDNFKCSLSLPLTKAVAVVFVSSSGDGNDDDVLLLTLWTIFLPITAAVMVMFSE
jgi:hypothetical protein